MASEPKTLQQAILFFSNYENCHRAVMAIRWPNGVVKCPTCGSDHVKYLASARVWKCYGQHPRPKFSLKVGTVFEDSPLPLQKWLPALWLIVNCKNGISSYELGRALGVTQKTAWFMLSRLRLALQSETGGKITGTVEVDETYIGGKSRNMHKAKRKRVGMVQGRNVASKVAVMGLFDRHGKDGVSQTRMEVRGGLNATPSKGACGNTSKSAPTSKMRSRRTVRFNATSPMRSSTTPKSTWTAKSTPTVARTSGVS